MKKFLALIGIILFTSTASFAAKIPDDVKTYIKDQIPQADIRFDGVITFPPNTIYLPLYPSLFSDIKTLKIKETYPANMTLKQEPDIIIFNNDFVLMKVLSDGQGHRTVLHQTKPPLQVRTGLLPQDMLVPSGLIIPENIKSIIGNLKIDTKNEDIIKLENQDAYEDFITKSEPVIQQGVISQLKNKILYVTTNYSKNIQVVEPGKSGPEYALSQKSIPIDVKAVNNGKFLIVTAYERPFLDVISVADSRFIKQISLNSNPEEILLNSTGDKAYITSPSASTIYVVDLKLMTLIQKIKVNGYCEHLSLYENKLFYVDKLRNEIWAIDMDKDYELKDIGLFPNTSSIAYADNKIFLASRTKSRIAVIDYDTLGLINEFTTVNKPTKTMIFNGVLYVLGSQNNKIQKININNNNVIGTIELESNGFAGNIHLLDNSGIAVTTDLKNNSYSIVDLIKGKTIKTYSLNVPVKDVIIADKVKLFN